MSRVVLHIGAMKSGTSYLQSCIYANRARLAEQGVHIPGDGWGSQVAAAINVRGKQLTQAGQDAEGAWDRMIEECRRHDGTTLISVELLARLRPSRIRKIAQDLAGLHVEVVVSVRDLNRTIPAMWQETVQNGRSWSWSEYVDGVRASGPTRTSRPWREYADGTIGRTFWSNHDAAAIVQRWSAVATDGTVTVVTVPPPGQDRTLLLRRFGEAVGFDPSDFVEGPRSNASLGAPSTEALRLMNGVLNERGLKFPFAIRVRKPLLAKSLMVRRTRSEPRIAFPVDRWMRRTSSRQVRELRSAGVRLHGDWADLAPVPLTEGVEPSALPAVDVAAALADGYEMLRTHLAAERSGATLPALWPVPTDPARVLREGPAALADLVEWAERGSVRDGVA